MTPTVAAGTTPDAPEEVVTVPFRSKAQARLMWALHPRIARRWVKESGSKHPIRNLPEKRTKRHSR